MPPARFGRLWRLISLRADAGAPGALATVRVGIRRLQARGSPRAPDWRGHAVHAAAARHRGAGAKVIGRRQVMCRRIITAFFVLLLATPDWVRGMGEILGETKEQLKLQYDVAVYDHGTGRVTITFTLEDEGRLKPLYGVEFRIPG